MKKAFSKVFHVLGKRLFSILASPLHFMMSGAWFSFDFQEGKNFGNDE